jgi:hypothetical protein
MIKGNLSVIRDSLYKRMVEDYRLFFISEDKEKILEIYDDISNKFPGIQHPDSLKKDKYFCAEFYVIYNNAKDSLKKCDSAIQKLKADDLNFLERAAFFSDIINAHSAVKALTGDF